MSYLGYDNPEDADYAQAQHEQSEAAYEQGLLDSGQHELWAYRQVLRDLVATFNNKLSDSVTKHLQDRIMTLGAPVSEPWIKPDDYITDEEFNSIHMPNPINSAEKFNSEKAGLGTLLDQLTAGRLDPQLYPAIKEKSDQLLSYLEDVHDAIISTRYSDMQDAFEAGGSYIEKGGFLEKEWESFTDFYGQH